MGGYMAAHSFCVCSASKHLKFHLLLTRFGALSVLFFELLCGIIFIVVVDPKY